MSPNDAVAEVFSIALHSLPRSERVALIAEDRSMRRELLHLAALAARRCQGSRLLRDPNAPKRPR